MFLNKNFVEEFTFPQQKFLLRNMDDYTTTRLLEEHRDCSSNKVCTVCTVPQTKFVLFVLFLKQSVCWGTSILFLKENFCFHVTSNDFMWPHVTSNDFMWPHVTFVEETWIPQRKFLLRNINTVPQTKFLLRNVNTVPQTKFLVEWPWTTLDHCWGTSILSLKQNF